MTLPALPTVPAVPTLPTIVVVAAAAAEDGSLDVSPGVLGFLVTLAVVLACIPLFRSMTSKIRGVQHRDPGGEDQGTPPSPDA